VSLTLISEPLQKHDHKLKNAYYSQRPCKPYEFPLNLPVFFVSVAVGIACQVLAICAAELVYRRSWWGWILLVMASVCLIGDLSTIGLGSPFAFWQFRWLGGENEHCQNYYEYFHRDKVYHKKFLTSLTLCNTFSDMANVLPKDKQIAVISALAEGSSIRSIERMTGIHRDTIMRLGLKIGKNCELLMDSKMQDLGCNYLQLDEVWGYIGKKERHCSVDDNPEYGDVWTFCAIDSETKLVPSFKCGKRTADVANEFIKDIAGRVRNRVQISTDAMVSYPQAIESAFGADVDYGQIVKVYVHDSAQHPDRKYSAPSFASAYRRAIAGNPEMEFVSTSHVERLNATTRLHVKRLNRLTLAFSKKLDNFKAAVALHFAYYNFVRRHNTLRCTPAMAAGVEKDFWTVDSLIEAVS
jgi:IS1 family transposase